MLSALCWAIASSLLGMASSGSASVSASTLTSASAAPKLSVAELEAMLVQGGLGEAAVAVPGSGAAAAPPAMASSSAPTASEQATPKAEAVVAVPSSGAVVAPPADEVPKRHKVSQHHDTWPNVPCWHCGSDGKASAPKAAMAASLPDILTAVQSVQASLQALADDVRDIKASLQALADDPAEAPPDPEVVMPTALRCLADIALMHAAPPDPEVVMPTARCCLADIALMHAGAASAEELAALLKSPLEGQKTAQAYTKIQEQGINLENDKILLRIIRDILVLQTCCVESRGPWNNSSLQDAMTGAFQRPIDEQTMSQLSQAFSKITKFGKDREEFDTHVATKAYGTKLIQWQANLIFAAYAVCAQGSPNYVSKSAGASGTRRRIGKNKDRSEQEAAAPAYVYPLFLCAAPPGLVLPS